MLLDQLAAEFRETEVPIPENHESKAETETESEEVAKPIAAQVKSDSKGWQAVATTVPVKSAPSAGVTGFKPISLSLKKGAPVMKKSFVPISLSTGFKAPQNDANPRVDVDLDGKPLGDPDLDGEPFVDPNLDGEPMVDPDLDGEPMVDPDLDGEPMVDPDLDGEPMADPDLDGEPLIDPDVDGEPLNLM